jgi:HlyD family secretion protein
MKKALWRILLLGLAGVAAFAAWRQWKLAHQSPVPEGIVFGNGRIESVQVDVAAKYGGRIKEILAREGDLVEDGQILAKMDTVELEAQLARDKATLAANEESAEEVRAEITKNESQMKLADVEYKRSSDLLSRRAISRSEYDKYRTALDSARASLDGSNAKLKTTNQSISAAAAVVKRTEAQIEDSILKSPVRGRVLYRLAEPGEVVGLGGNVLTLINLNDVYMEIFLPAQEAARVKMGAEARVTLDVRPEYSAEAKVSYVSPEAQFTPKQVETRSERDKLMFRVKLQVPPEIVMPFIERIKTGVRGIGYVRLDDTAAWPAFLDRPFPKPEESRKASD